jgi:hypothetical protein
MKLKKGSALSWNKKGLSSKGMLRDEYFTTPLESSAHFARFSAIIQRNLAAAIEPIRWAAQKSRVEHFFEQ